MGLGESVVWQKLRVLASDSFVRMDLSGREVDVDLSVGLFHVFRKVGGSR